MALIPLNGKLSLFMENMPGAITVKPAFNDPTKKAAAFADLNFSSVADLQEIQTYIHNSGGDTTLKGAVVAANTVRADVDGNLNIQSLQDTSTYTSRQSSVGGSITLGPGGVPTEGSLSAGKSTIDSNYQSVTQQSGIQAGDGGFQVSVNNNTDLKGGVIASTQAAVDQNRNTFTTGGTLTTRYMHQYQRCQFQEPKQTSLLLSLRPPR